MPRAGFGSGGEGASHWRYDSDGVGGGDSIASGGGFCSAGREIPIKASPVVLSQERKRLGADEDVDGRSLQAARPLKLSPTMGSPIPTAVNIFHLPRGVAPGGLVSVGPARRTERKVRHEIAFVRDAFLVLLAGSASSGTQRASSPPGRTHHTFATYQHR